MNKIPFEDGQLISPAYLKEDGTIEEAVYGGNTPLSAFNLNKMQDNIEQHRYGITLTEDVIDNSQIIVPANYKVGTDSLKVYFEGELLERGIHYDEVRRRRKHKQHNTNKRLGRKY